MDFDLAQHVTWALQATGGRPADRTPLYRQYRTMLRNGPWQQKVVAELTKATAIEQVTIQWPDGQTQVLKDLAIDQLHRIVQE